MKGAEGGLLSLTAPTISTTARGTCCLSRSPTHKSSGKTTDFTRLQIPACNYFVSGSAESLRGKSPPPHTHLPTHTHTHPPTHPPTHTYSHKDLQRHTDSHLVHLCSHITVVQMPAFRGGHTPGTLFCKQASERRRCSVITSTMSV